MAGLIAMTSALAVVAVESYLAARGAAHAHSHAWEDDEDAEDDDGHDGHMDGGALPMAGLAATDGSGRRSRRPEDITVGGVDAETEGLVAGVSPLPGSTPLAMRPRRSANADDSDGESESDLDLDVDELDPTPLNGSQSRPLALKQRHHSHAKSASLASLGAMSNPPSPEEQHRLLIQCLLLEAGILFHSIFIGMAVSVATGPTFAVFLVAICFHQSFEGLALGSRIAAIHFPRGSLRPWLMVLAFGATTPLGQLIGLVVHELYDPASQAGLVVVGVMNAVSAGLLLFAGLVQLLAEDFLSQKSYRNLKGWRRVRAYLAVVGGAGLMAAVGALA